MTGYETALVVVAACFIIFALVVALVVPRSRPGFPANRLGLFLAICGIFFVAQITAVLVLAEKGEADESVHETTVASHAPAHRDAAERADAGRSRGRQAGLRRSGWMRRLPHALRRRRDRAGRARTSTT